MIEAGFDPYASGVLKKDVHAQLVHQLEDVAKDARIHPRWVCQSVKPILGAKEIEWLKQYRFTQAQGTSAGLCITGEDMSAKVIDHMSAMAGALLRNEVRARVFTVENWLAAADNGAPPVASCLLIPNLYLGEAMGVPIPKWKSALLYDMLSERHQTNKPTVIYVSSVKGLSKEYGKAFANLIEANYQII